VTDFYLDHNVSSQLATLLHRRGHTVVSARQIGRERGDDAEHLFIAAQQQRITITHIATISRCCIAHGCVGPWAGTSRCPTQGL
jgi:predicted nuclease of predicted toxin-antitoxin system